MPREDGLKAGIAHRFSSTNQPTKRGRLPSKLKKFVRDNSLSKSDVDMLYKNILGKTYNELQEMIKPENRGELPILVIGFISSCISDVKNGTMREMNNHIDRVWGKATQYVDLDAGGDMFLTTMTPEERDKRIRELLEKREKKQLAKKS